MAARAAAPAKGSRVFRHSPRSEPNSRRPGWVELIPERGRPGGAFEKAGIAAPPRQRQTRDRLRCRDGFAGGSALGCRAFWTGIGSVNSELCHSLPMSRFEC